MTTFLELGIRSKVTCRKVLIVSVDWSVVCMTSPSASVVNREERYSYAVRKKLGGKLPLYVQFS